MSGTAGHIEITRLTKEGGVLTKCISLAPDGGIRSDGSACVMSAGAAVRMSFEDVSTFANCIARLLPNEAIALGRLREDLPEQVEIVTKSKLADLNGHAGPSVISRSAGQITYRPGEPALALIDYDVKAMPEAVKDAIKLAGGVWGALVHVLPELAGTTRVQRTSTSSGIIRSDTGAALAGSGGMHVYLLVRDGADIERFLHVLHARCWLAGFGWSMIGAAGQLLERSIVDRMVGAPERLVFEAAPILTPPLTQDAGTRTPNVIQGNALDTRAVLDLSVVEQAQLRALRRAEAQRLAPASKAAREAFITRQAARIVDRTGCQLPAARQVVERQRAGVLLPAIALSFDDAALRGATVADVLSDPERFIGATLADPLEGVEYGAHKAMVMRRDDGTMWIHSFAHGRTTYDLKYDAALVEAELRKAPEQAADILVRLFPVAELAPDKDQALRELACELANAKPRPLILRLKAARQQHEERQQQARREAVAGHLHDARLRLPAPDPDAERLPSITALDEVLNKKHAAEPPMRDVEGRMIEPRARSSVLLHDMIPTDANFEEADTQ